MTITISFETAQSLKAILADGTHGTESEVVAEALEEWLQRRVDDPAKLDALREAIGKGDASGDSIPADFVYDELRSVIAAKRSFLS